MSGKTVFFTLYSRYLFTLQEMRKDAFPDQVVEALNSTKIIECYSLSAASFSHHPSSATVDCR